MKKYLFALFLVFVLSSCFSSTTPVDSSSLKEYTWSGFTISVPKSWVVVDKTSLPPIKSSTVALALTSPEVKSMFSNNMAILKIKTKNDLSSKNFSKQNNFWATWYKSYLKLTESDITFIDNTVSSLYIFEAQYNETTPKFKYLQTWVVCTNLDAYLITLALNLDVKDTSKYEDMLKTFKCN